MASIYRETLLFQGHDLADYSTPTFGQKIPRKQLEWLVDFVRIVLIQILILDEVQEEVVLSYFDQGFLFPIHWEESQDAGSL